MSDKPKRFVRYMDGPAEGLCIWLPAYMLNVYHGNERYVIRRIATDNPWSIYFDAFAFFRSQ